MPEIPENKLAPAFPDNAFFLHAGVVSVPKGAILLLGHSSSGKTTLCSMLSSRFPVVADDIVFAFCQKAAGWRIMDGKFFKSELYKDRNFSFDLLHNQCKTYPVHLLIRIFAAQQSEIKPISSAKICEYLMDAVFEIDIQRSWLDMDLRRRWFKNAADLARRHPGLQLKFSLDEKQVCCLLEEKMEMV